MARADKLKHGPIAWRTAMRLRSRRFLVFAAVAPAVFLPPIAIARLTKVPEIRVGFLAVILFAPLQAGSWLAEFAKGHTGLLFAARGRGVVNVRWFEQLRAGSLQVQQSGVRYLVFTLPLRHGSGATLEKPRGG